jgi:hypothetical protein
MKGHIRERGKGNWYAVLSVRDPETGKRKVKWRSLPDCKGKREAQHECARLITEMRNGGYVEADKATVAQFLDRWLEQVKSQISPRTYERYAEIAHKNLAPALGAIRLTKLQPIHIPHIPRPSPAGAGMAGAGCLQGQFTICTAF